MAIQKIQQAFKYALDPTPRQTRIFTSHAGAARYAYNWGLTTFSDSLNAYREQKDAGVEPTAKLPDHFTLCKLWTSYKDDPENELDWVAENSVSTYQSALRDAHASWKNFLDSKAGRRKGRLMGRPRYKSRHRTLPSFQLHGTGLRLADHRHVNLPRVGTVRTHEKTKKLRRLLDRPQVACLDCQGTGTAPKASNLTGVKKKNAVKILKHLALLATVFGATPELGRALHQATRRDWSCKTCKGTGRVDHTRIVRSNVSRTPSGRWYVSLTVETHRDTRTTLHKDGTYAPKPSKRQRAGGVVGIDWGVRDIATLSNGEIIENPRHLKAALSDLRHAQQNLSRKADGSHRREKARRRVAKLHGRVASLRKDHLEKITSDLVHRYAGIVIEGWDVQQVMEHGSADIPKRVRRNRNLAMSDTGIGMARWMMEHKTAWYGASIHTTGTYEPTGRTCSACMTVRTKPLAPAQDTFTCPFCGHSSDRRINTARVLVRIARTHDAPSSGESQNARGGGVRPSTLRRDGQPPLKREARSRSSGRGKAGTPDP